MPKLNIALVSDFRDYYNHWFGRILKKLPLNLGKFDYILCRNLADRMIKRPGIELLEEAGFRLPNPKDKIIGRHRIIVVGDRMFLINLEEPNRIEAWHKRSDYVDRYNSGYLRPYPVFSIDHIFCEPNGRTLALRAVDFNPTPLLKGTGIEDILPAKECAEAIYEYVEREGLCDT